MTRAHPPRVLMVSPRFNPNSFWSFRATCELRGARWLAPPLGLITLAAMLPERWQIRLLDHNIEDFGEADLAGVDLVMTGGMLPQELDLRAILELCARIGTPVCIGGAAPTSTPEKFEDADFLVVGEAEGVIDEFIAAWERGDRRGRFDAPKFQADVTKTPVPRFDLLRFRSYLWVNVQFSRGCPFTCEFCDIIELFGRVPRTKTSPQMLAELDRLFELGYRGQVDFVDDNLIGNKKAIKQFLPHLVQWQERMGYPFKFSTEASLNLADDPELLRMMRDANFIALFTGIESPDESTLIQMQKKQNTRRSIAESVHRIIDAGMFVSAGFIIGFDEEKKSVAGPIIECIRDSHIPASMVGLLTALPNTQLSRRLQREGRLVDDFREAMAQSGDHSTAGLNFVTLRPRLHILQDLRHVVDTVFRPEAYFARVRRLGRRLNAAGPKAGKIWWGNVRDDALAFVRTAWMASVTYPELAAQFWYSLWVMLRVNPRGLVVVVANSALYAHLYPYSRKLVTLLDAHIADLQRAGADDMAVEPVTLAARALAS